MAYIRLVVVSLVLLFDAFCSDTKGDHRSVNVQLNDDIDFMHLCEDGIPLMLEDDQPKSCSPHSTVNALQCPSSFWCHIGSTNATNYCCPKNRKVKSLCHLRPATGFGKGKMRRYAYDLTSGRCKELIYTGYGGNENNFLTLADCYRSCQNSAQATLPPTTKSVNVERIGYAAKSVSIAGK
ncbi:unnamed protein product [Toxocara canis]|uniref:BPTI/Kunitz inhibitor domain-containing protein n=1 Tax=Toxocara canis TaxID=6265 RepID=A0A183V907_TOXCA|nr:unnamed protein product [Toxocara canis]